MFKVNVLVSLLLSVSFANFEHVIAGWEWIEEPLIAFDNGKLNENVFFVSSEAYLGPCQTFKMEHYAKIVNG